MRLLHIGSGFRPWRRGGLVAYVEDLMDEQVRRGHHVDYFFSGRQYPYLRGPRLRRWERNGVAMLEALNSPIFDHGRQPQAEMSEPRLERMLERLLEERRPDVVHVHELAGLPSSFLDVVEGFGVPAVFTLQDYFLLCPTFKLLDSEGRVCLRRQIGADCVATTTAEPHDPGLLIDATIRHDVWGLPLVRRLGPERLERYTHAVAQHSARRRRGTGEAPDLASLFQRRRDLNVERLNRTTCLVAMSSRVAEIYSLLGVDPDRIRTLHLTLAHVERLRPRPRGRRGSLTFATLAGLESTAKGSRLLVDAMRIVQESPAAKQIRLIAYGFVDPAVVDEVARLPIIECRGRYRAPELDSFLDEVDVGLVPSIWEEAFGYVGLELLAKGIPVIANAIGGMVDYTREGQTGWLNHSLSAEELAALMIHLAEDPEEVDALSDKVRAQRDSLVKSMARHGDEMDAVYQQSLNSPRPGWVS